MHIQLQKKIPSGIFLGRMKAHCLQLFTFSSLKRWSSDLNGIASAALWGMGGGIVVAIALLSHICWWWICTWVLPYQLNILHVPHIKKEHDREAWDLADTRKWANFSAKHFSAKIRVSLCVKKKTPQNFIDMMRIMAYESAPIIEQRQLAKH